MREPPATHAAALLGELVIAPRFCGPPDAGNGGYVAGLLAGYAAGPVDVRLLRPLPLGVPLALTRDAADGLALSDAAMLLATATPAALELAVPPAPSFAAATEAALGYAAIAGEHAAPRCFVCGPARAPGDGLRLATGALAPAGAGGLHAAPWVPDASLAGTRGRVRPEFVAAALDCPGYFAIADDARMRVLGRMSLAIEAPVAVGERCVVAAWSLGGAGRKRDAATAVYAASGQCVARAVATWLELRSA